MIPKFKIGRSDRLFICEKYLSNGHWLVTRDAAKSPSAPKALKPLLSVVPGAYHYGLVGGMSTDKTPDVAQVIPRRDCFVALSPDPVGVKFRNCDWIESYIFQCDGFKIGIDPKYIPLLRMGHAFAGDAFSPILVLDSRELSGELLAIVMPMRISEKEGAQ